MAASLTCRAWPVQWLAAMAAPCWASRLNHTARPGVGPTLGQNLSVVSKRCTVERLAGAHPMVWRRLAPIAEQSCYQAPIAQSAERLHGKEKVKGSIPFRGSFARQKTEPKTGNYPTGGHACGATFRGSCVLQNRTSGSYGFTSKSSNHAMIALRVPAST